MIGETPRLYRAAGAMTVGTAFSRVTGLVRVVAMTSALGVTGTKLADTYNLANTTPNIVYELFLGGILTSVFVPVLIEARGSGGVPRHETRRSEGFPRDHGRGDESALVSVSLLALAVLSVLCAIGAPLIMRVYTFRVSDPVLRAQQLELASFLLRWFAPQIFFYGVSAIAAALLNVRGRFAPPAFAPVVNNLVVAATFLTYARVVGSQELVLSTGAKVLLGAGTTAGVVTQALILLPAIRGERLRVRFDFRDPAVSRMLRLAAYVIGYVAVNQIGLWVVLALANGVTGGVTAWQVAYIFFQLPHGLFAVSLHTALFPELSRAAATGDWQSYRQQLSRGVRGVAYLLVPAALGYGLLAHPITRVVIARGVAGTSDAEAVARVLVPFAAGLLFFSTFALLMRGFYALPDTRTPAAINAVAVGVMIALAFPFFAWLGVRGVAFAHAASYVLGVALLGTVLARRVPGGLQARALIAPLLRIVAAAAGMGACVFGLRELLEASDLVIVAVCSGAGAILYVAFSQVMGIEERLVVLSLLRRRRSS